MQLPTYVNRPFRPPRRINSAGSDSGSAATGKRLFETLPPPPRQDVKRPKNEPGALDEDRKFFTIMYRKPSTKKHKTWNGDGFAQLKQGNKLVFYNESGKYFGGTSINGSLESHFENVARAGSLEVQLDYEITDPKEQTKIRSLIETGNESTTRPSSKSSLAPTPKSSPPRLTPKVITKFRSSIKPSKFQTPTTGVNSVPDKHDRTYLPVFDTGRIENPIIMNKSSEADVDVVIDPMLGKCLRTHQKEGVKFMYDCVMGLSRPDDDDAETTSKSLVLEKDSDIQGCILADEMGLGKTLMTITLIWTLLKQTPMASKVPCSQNGVPLQGLCNKMVIVCPVTLIANWKREFGKWLNLSRIGILTLSSQNNAERDNYDVKNFLKVQRTYQVLIIGYEKLLSVSKELETGKNVIDLLVCDEGHRLKNGSSKVLNVLKNLDIPKKIILSGTPIQNDLNEFFTIIDFINPGVLGSYQFFKKRFMTPISKARDPANKFNLHIVERGQERSEEMISITKRFILRRTNSILAKYLPPKMDLIFFCKPTSHQISAFRDILQGANINLQHLNFSSSLALITLMKKVCNSPSLIQSDSYYKSNMQNSMISQKYQNGYNSGKLQVLMKLLHQIRISTPNDKVVIISNYTQTLDIVGNLMASAGMSSCRLDGSTPAKQRDSIVNNFNNSPSLFAFLLSAKSGGVGLNLIGACRLILFDNDWNPAVDLQAMSRIHRDGQKKPCYIYRLVTTGCIDEKILQRQLMKNCLSQKFLSDTKTNKGNADDDLFNKEDLKDLFTVLMDTSSNTHDLICSCEGVGEEVILESRQDSENNKNYEISGERKLSQWNSALEAQKVMEEIEAGTSKGKERNIKKCLIGYKHIDPSKNQDLLDDVATEALSNLQNDITFAFVHPSEDGLVKTAAEGDS